MDSLKQLELELEALLQPTEETTPKKIKKKSFFQIFTKPNEYKNLSNSQAIKKISP
tara:strand:+ start:3075 stop:3242 length:168 start_codon:yes stop_codon:yes gene_type:complete